VEFTVDCTKSGSGDITVNINSAKRKTVPVAITDNGDNTYTVTYEAQVAGPQTIVISLDDTQVPQSPIKLDIKPPVDLNKISLIDFEPEAFVDCPNDFIVDTSNLPSNLKAEIQCEISGPDGNPVEADVTRLEPEGPFQVSYIPTEEGDHEIDLRYDGSPLPDSPYPVTAIRGCNPNKVKAYGDGLEKAIVDEPNIFTIETRNAGTGGLGIAVEGPSEAEMNCADNKDGTCTVEYVPVEEGDYDINIKFDDDHIPGSPFQVPATTRDGKPKADARKVAAYGPGLEPGSIFPGKPTSFVVDASATGSAPVEVFIGDADDNDDDDDDDIHDNGGLGSRKGSRFGAGDDDDGLGSRKGSRLGSGGPDSRKSSRYGAGDDDGLGSRKGSRLGGGEGDNDGLGSRKGSRFGAGDDDGLGSRKGSRLGGGDNDGIGSRKGSRLGGGDNDGLGSRKGSKLGSSGDDDNAGLGTRKGLNDLVGDDNDDGYGIGNKMGRGLAALKARGSSLSGAGDPSDDLFDNDGRRSSSLGGSGLDGRKGSSSLGGDKNGRRGSKLQSGSSLENPAGDNAGSRKSSRDLDASRKGSRLPDGRCGKNLFRKPTITDKGDGLHEVSYVPPPVGDPYEVYLPRLQNMFYSTKIIFFFNRLLSNMEVLTFLAVHF
jgi:hypothetical protein